MHSSRIVENRNFSRSTAGPEGATKSEARLSPIIVLYLLCVIIPIGFHIGPLYLTTLRIFLLVLITPLLLRLISGHYGRLYFFDLFFILHVVWMGIALAITSPNQMLTQLGSVGSEFLGGYLIGRAYIRTKSQFIGLCRILIIAVLSLTPLAIYESRTGDPIIIQLLSRIPSITTVDIATIEGRIGLERVQASFAHPIHFGLFCSVAFSLSFVAMRDFVSTTRRVITSVVIALTGFLALSSGAILAIALQILLIAWSLAFARLMWRWWLLIGLFVVAYVVIDLASNRSPIRVFMSYAVFSSHNAYWRGLIFEWGIMNVFGSPEHGIPSALAFGIGMNDWVRPSFMHSGSVDNFWLLLALRYGVPAFLLFIVGYVVALFLVMRRDFDADSVLQNIRQAWVFTFLGLTFTLSTVHVWTNIYSFVFFMFGAGIWLIGSEASGSARRVRDLYASQSNRHNSMPQSSVSTGNGSEPEQKAWRYTRFPTRSDDHDLN